MSTGGGGRVTQKRRLVKQERKVMSSSSSSSSSMSKPKKNNNYRSGEKTATDDERRMRLLRRWETLSSWLGAVLRNDTACRQLRRILISPAKLSFSTYSSHSWLTINMNNHARAHNSMPLHISVALQYYNPHMLAFNGLTPLMRGRCPVKNLGVIDLQRFSFSVPSETWSNCRQEGHWK